MNMEIRKGDKVKFLNEAGGGIVSRIINEKQALVLIEEGFEIPVSITELLKSEPQADKKSEPVKQNPKILQTKKTEKAKSEKALITTTGIENNVVKPLFAIVPTIENMDNENAKFDLFLLNDGGYYFHYLIAVEKNNKFSLLEKGDLEPELKITIGSFDIDKLLAMDALVINLLLYKEEEYNLQLPVHYRINLKSLNLLNKSNYTDNDYFYELAHIIDISKVKEILQKDLIKNPELKKKIEVPYQKNVHKEKDTEEIDLHIEEIADDVSNLSNSEIINIQISRLTVSLNTAINNKTRKIVFIHGQGNGKLRYELRKVLDTKYPYLQYQDASYAEYGYGATLVIIRK